MCIVDVCVRWMVVRRWVQMLKELVGILFKLELFENAVTKTCEIICIVFNRVVKRGRTWCYEGGGLVLHGLHANLTCWTS